MRETKRLERTLEIDLPPVMFAFHVKHFGPLRHSPD